MVYNSKELPIFDINAAPMKAVLNILLNIRLQANSPETGPVKQELSKLESTILIPAFCVVLIVVIIGSIAVAAQKHKRL